MAAGLTGNHEVDNLQFMSLSGMANIGQALKDISKWAPEHNIFFEMSACAGSCINGPKAARNTSVARRRYDIVQYAKAASVFPREPSLAIARSYEASPAARNEYSDLQLRDALRTVGKYSVEDELNCGGCGYDSCRDFARALIPRNAERMMCATYTRKLAQKNASQRYLKFAPAGRLSDDLVVWTRTQEGDRWRHSQSCLAACWSLYTTVLTEW